MCRLIVRSVFMPLETIPKISYIVTTEEIETVIAVVASFVSLLVLLLILSTVSCFIYSSRKKAMKKKRYCFVVFVMIF